MLIIIPGSEYWREYEKRMFACRKESVNVNFKYLEAT